MIYKLDFTPASRIPASFVYVSGVTVTPVDRVQFVPWQPSKWPEAPADDFEFTMLLKRIFELSMLIEIKNVIEDAHARNGDLQHRGHVVAISLLCALDAISSYGYGPKSGKQIPDFVLAHFPNDYKPFAEDLLTLYRHAMIHSWNLFGVAIKPGNEHVTTENGIIVFGLLNLFEALKEATENFLQDLSGSAMLQEMARKRYNSLRATAKPAAAAAP